MSEHAPENTPEQDPAPTPDPAPAAEPETFDADYVKKLRAEAAKYRTEAKAATAEAEKARKASMSEAEKAVADAEARGRTAAVSEFGQRLVRSDFVAAAARRNPEYDATGVLDDLNLAKFVGDDGEPDAKAIAAAVDRLVPAAVVAAPRYGNADQGVRPTTQDPGMNDLMRRALGRT